MVDGFGRGGSSFVAFFEGVCFALPLQLLLDTILVRAANGTQNLRDQQFL